MRTHFIIPVCLVALTGCRELKARLDNTSVVVSAPGCFGSIGVGDSLQLRAAVVSSRSAGAGFSHPLDGGVHYSSDDNPKSFRWLVKPENDRGGEAHISERGLFVARAPGSMRVKAISIGDTSHGTTVVVLPRITWRGVSPRDTTISTGDTLVIRIDAEVEEKPWYNYVRWTLPRYSDENPALITQVERDPDDTSRRDTRLLGVVAERPGEARIAMCAVGNRADTIVVRIKGERVRRNRDVPPVVRLRPADTTVYMGHAFRIPVRLINTRLRNGPWTWKVEYGDGGVDTGTVENNFDTSAWGREIALGYDHEHVYRALGTYTITMTVTDSAGRTGTAQRRVTAIGHEITAEAFPGRESKVLRLSDTTRFLPIAFYSTSQLTYSSIYTLAYTDPRFARLSVVKIGRTAWRYEPDLIRPDRNRDVNGDGREDLILPVNISDLVRNGDLRLGRNQLVITGPINRGGREGEPVRYTPFRAVVTVDVVR